MLEETPLRLAASASIVSASRIPLSLPVARPLALGHLLASAGLIAGFSSAGLTTGSASALLWRLTVASACTWPWPWLRLRLSALPTLLPLTLSGHFVSTALRGVVGAGPLLPVLPLSALIAASLLALGILVTAAPRSSLLAARLSSLVLFTSVLGGILPLLTLVTASLSRLVTRFFAVA